MEDLAKDVGTRSTAKIAQSGVVGVVLTNRGP
jgi:hypothetical protein